MAFLLGAAISLGAGAIASLFQPTRYGPRQANLIAPKGDYGNYLSRIWGTVRVPGNGRSYKF